MVERDAPDTERVPFADVAAVLLGEHYRVEAEIGSGSAGTVYRARDERSGETVALKLVVESGVAHRFAREATTLARLSHPAIVRYITHGTSAQGRMFLVMEWLEGEDLERRLARGPLGWQSACAVALRIAEALAHAHAFGLVHRDLGPRNVFLPGGRPEEAKLLDFGLVRVVDPSAVDRTATQAILGTPQYMAPEQIRSSKEVDARADLFSLGVLLHEMISGRPPFDAPDLFALWWKILEEPAPPLVVPGAPPELALLVAALLAKNPASRPVSAAVVEGVLRDLGRGGPIAPMMLPRPAVSAAPPPVDAKRRRSYAIVAGVVVGAGLAGLLARPLLATGDASPPALSTSPSPSPSSSSVAPSSRATMPTAPPLSLPPGWDSDTYPPSLTRTRNGTPSVRIDAPFACGDGEVISGFRKTLTGGAAGPTTRMHGRCSASFVGCHWRGGGIAMEIDDDATVALVKGTVEGTIVLRSRRASLVLRETKHGPIINDVGASVVEL